LSIAYALDSKDSFSHKNIDTNIKAALTQFGAKIKIKTAPKFHGMKFDQAINFFHVPTKESFVK
jgi:hypothetical protein